MDKKSCLVDRERCISSTRSNLGAMCILTALNSKFPFCKAVGKPGGRLHGTNYVKENCVVRCKKRSC